jgi:hypothetical protein
MRTNLLEFLFGAAVVRETQGRDLGEQIVSLFEKADEVEGVEMVANKKPLGDALKALGIDEPVKAGVQCCEIHCDDDAEYHEYVRILANPDAITKLAEMGWVSVKSGDIAMANEKPDYKISFIEIQTAETTDGDKPKDLEKIRKDAQKDAAAEFERGGKKKENPVELDDPDMGGKQEGVGEPSDGKDPEGKPKGSTKKVKESRARNYVEGRYTPKAVVDELLEMTGTSAVPAFPSGGNPMSINSPRSRALPRRKSKPAPPKPHGVSPANS